MLSFVPTLLLAQVVNGSVPPTFAAARPILEANCVGCHGPTKQSGSFRVDTGSALLAPGDDGPRLVPGKAKESQLYKLVAGVDPDERMPPEGRKPALKPAEVEVIRAWIDAGAPWPAGVTLTPPPEDVHWAFVPPTRPPVPKVRTPGWVRTPIDAFVLAKLEAEGLAPAAPADRITLLRRLSFDLVGLPPSVAEVDAFVADRAPNAVSKVIERLLASPAYGERWARHWLDAAHYADSDGYEKDKKRSIWPYRDWVIDAFNRDLPYDRFLTEQLAGDLLPGPATPDRLIATGFLRNSMINEEGGTDPEQFRTAALIERMEVLGKGVLGLTTQCAQCHDHKYDPISQKEYYGLFAFLNQDDEASIPVYLPEQERTRRDVLARIAALEAGLRQKTPDLEAKMAAWEAQVTRTVAQREAAWTVLQAPFDDDSTGGEKLLRLPDGSFLAQGFAPTRHEAYMPIETPLKKIGAVRLELLTDPNLPLGGPGRAFDGTCALTELSVTALPLGASPEQKQKLVFARAKADFEQPARPLGPVFRGEETTASKTTGPASFAIDGKDDTAWGIDAGPGRRNADREAVFVLAKPVESASGFKLGVKLKQEHGGKNADDNVSNNLGRFRVSVAETPDVDVSPVPPSVRRLLAVPRAKRTAAQQASLFSYYRTTVPQWRDVNAAIEAEWKRFPDGAPTLVLAKRPQPRVTHLLEKGEYPKFGPEIAAAVPKALNPFPKDAPTNRLGLARWLTDRKAPTTARVIANRVWQAYFGAGLVTTSEDFGVQGDKPSHPELLDWLAVELMDHGWSLKHLHRLITNSAVYQQASVFRPELRDKDPYNRLLARGPRVRVEGEVVRDSALAVSGLLDGKRGGPPIMPPAPAFLFLPPVSYAVFPWIEATGSERYRRSVYVFRRRTTPLPFLQTFDVPSGDVSCPRRLRTNTPLQALVTLNEGSMMEAARALARVMMSHGSSPEEHIQYGFRRVLSRVPDPAELAELRGLLDRQRERVTAGWADPWGIATGGMMMPASLPSGVTPSELASYTVVARVLLNLDEAITKE